MKIVLAAALAILAMPALAQQDHYVSGYTRSNGTYVAPHYQTNPNNTRVDNYSSYPNVNPYTGQQGHVDPYAPKPAPTNPYATDNPYEPR